MAARIFLGFSALVWLPYGVFCFAQPSFLAEAAGIHFVSTTGNIELRAMYGGLQTGIGVLAAVAIVRPGLRTPALATLAFLCGGLALARLGGAGIEGEWSSYTVIGLCFEVISSSVASWLLMRAAADATARTSP